MNGQIRELYEMKKAMQDYTAIAIKLADAEARAEKAEAEVRRLASVVFEVQMDNDYNDDVFDELTYEMDTLYKRLERMTWVKNEYKARANMAKARRAV